MVRKSSSSTAKRHGSVRPRRNKTVTGRRTKKQPGGWLKRQYQRAVNLRKRRPHHSFVRTRRRDYRRALVLPGYISFTLEVARTLFARKALFGTLIITFSTLAILLGGLSSSQTYSQLAETVSGEGGNLSGVSQVALLAAATMTNTPSSEVQQLYIGFLVIMTWLTTVWLLRELQAGKSPRFRDGLYSAGAPLMATIVLSLTLLVQLLPLGVLAVAYSALSELDLINQGLGAFLFFGIAALVIALTLYWITSTFFALIISTLPGMYPWRAMRAAGDIVVGRRLRILFRLLWLGACTLLLWAIIMIPTILLDQYLRQNFEWYGALALVPVLTIVLSSTVAVWVSVYIYLLYRKVVASDDT